MNPSRQAIAEAEEAAVVTLEQMERIRDRAGLFSCFYHKAVKQALRHRIFMAELSSRADRLEAVSDEAGCYYHKAKVEGCTYCFTSPLPETCPACNTPTRAASGIGPYCPNKECGRADDLSPVRIEGGEGQ